MRVLILCTGRCGSTTFIKACGHIENYSSGHESLTRIFGAGRFAYPENHIEADNRLCWHLGELDCIFGDGAFYVHLTRNSDKVAQSYAKRYGSSVSIMESYCKGIKMTLVHYLSNGTKLQACYDYIQTVDANIKLFLKDKTRKMDMQLENFSGQFPVFWRKIKAEGDLEKAMAEFEVSYNAS